MAENGSVTIKIKGDDSDFAAKMQKLGSVAQKGLSVATKTIAATGAALTGLAGMAVKVGSSFESGMSQVAATMGITVDEIQAGSKEFEILKQAAKDAGATTKFSATEASEALNYLALAGYDAEKAAGALPSVLNLAAAGGLDLAYASDLATDAMAALGIEATSDNLTAFGDKMAKVAQKSNTSVAQLGEAILTVGGTAKSLAGGTTELNTALGVLANRGIKGAEGGTALRNVILSLSAPTDVAAKAMKELGLQVYDAEGNMRPLNEVFKDLNQSMEGMTEGEKTQVLNEIFNKVDLKSAQALLAGCGDEFDNLAAAIANSGGAMESMAETQIDNLEGSITILKSALEGLGISVYEGMQEPLKEGVRAITDMVGELDNVVKEEGVKGLTAAMGEMLAKGIASVADYSPKMIDAGVNIISSFLDGIGDNSGSISKAALQIGESLAGGLTKIIPKAASAGKDILQAFTKELGNAVPLFKPLAKITELLTDNFNSLAGIAVTAFGALKGYAVISSIATSYQTAALQVGLYTAAMNLSTITNVKDLAVLTTKEITVGVLTGKIALATAAQYAWNTAIMANPIGLVIAGVAALSAAIVLLHDNTEDEITIYQRSIDESKEKQKALREEADAYSKLKEEADKRAAGEIAQLDSSTRLYDRLTELVDVNGKVKDGEEERAKLLADELSKALGIEINLVDGQIQKYGELKDAVNNAVLAKKAEIMLSTREEAYKTALEEKDAALEASAKAHEEYNNAKNEADRKRAEYEQWYADHSKEIAMGAYEQENALMKSEMLAAENAANEKKNMYDAAADNLNNYYADIETYDKAYALSAEGRYGEVIDLINGKSDAVRLAKITDGKNIEEQKQALIEALNEEKAKYDEVLKGIAEGREGFTSDMLSEIVESQKTIKDEMYKLGLDAIRGVISGLDKGEPNIIDAVNSMASLIPGTVREVIDSHSPSRVMKKMFEKDFTDGIVLGIKGGTPKVVSSIKNMSTAAIKSAKKYSKDYKEMGRNCIDLMAEGIDKQADELKSSLDDVCDKQIKAYEKALKEEQELVIKQKEALKENATDADKERIDKEIEVIKEGYGTQKEEYTKSAKGLMDAYKEAISNGAEEANELINDKISSITEEWQKQRDDILKDQEEMREKLSSYGDLFDYDEEDNLVLANINENIDALGRYEKALESLKEKLEEQGFSDDFLSVVTDMGVVDGTAFAEKLLNSGNGQFDKYITSWETQQKKAKEIAEKFYADELEALDKNFSGKLDDTLAEIPELLKNIGIDSMSGWIEGMKDKEGELYSEVRRIAREMVSAMREELDVNSPSKVIAREVGAPVAEGVFVGAEKEFKESRSRFGEIGNMLVSGMSGAFSSSPLIFGSSLVKENSTVKEVSNNTIIKEKVVGIDCKGGFKEVARALRPYIVNEDNRIGGNLIKNMG